MSASWRSTPASDAPDDERPDASFIPHQQSAFYVTLSSQVALDKRLTTIAENVANSNTIGYRATGVSFEAALSKATSGTTHYVSAGTDFISRASGGLFKTDNPLDLGVVGNGPLQDDGSRRSADASRLSRA